MKVGDLVKCGDSCGIVIKNQEKYNEKYAKVLFNNDEFYWMNILYLEVISGREN